MSKMINLKNVSRIFRTGDIETSALSKINFNIKQGEFVAIMGPSGCGKSTLLSILGMLDSPSSGVYEFEDVDISRYSEKELASIRKASLGFIFQNFNLINELSVSENVELPLQYLKISKKERALRLDKILKRVAIDHRADHMPHQLSGGQQQRVAIARALIINPKLILADEPTGNLDSKNGEEVMLLLKELNESGTTVIMVTHSEKEGNFADRVLRMMDGQLIWDKSNDLNTSLVNANV
jgi:putative ABC transport system ATP-binding protein